MSDSTSELRTRRTFYITDVLKSVADLHDSEYPATNQFRNEEQIADVWHSPRRNEYLSFSDYQHAAYRAQLRELGRAEPNATAEPESRLRLNQYTEDHASRLECRIREFLSFGEDWDGDGAREIPFAAIYASLNFLDEFRRRFCGSEPRSAAPSADGEIAVYWHGPTGYAEVNFDGTGRISMCRGDDSDEIELIEEELESFAEIDTSGIWAALSEFLGQHLATRKLSAERSSGVEARSARNYGVNSGKHILAANARLCQ